MNIRERFNAVLHWQKPDRLPNMDFGYWKETLEIWHEQGLPPEIDTNVKAEEYFGLDGSDRIPSLPVSIFIHPSFEYKILEDEGDRLIIRDGEGVISEVFKHGASIPHYLKFPIETRKDWEKIKTQRLRIDDPARKPNRAKLKAFVDKAHADGMPVRVNAGSLYGWLRNLMGVENFSIAILTDKEWVEEMMEHLTQLILHVLDNVLSGLDVDVAWWWEDMCYNHGPLISPALFNELMVPRYKRITDMLRSHGIDVNVLDCDGNIHELVPGWLEGGINCMFPLETTHTNAEKIRQIHGNEVLLFGNANKIELAKGHDAIDREIERLGNLVEKGGFIPCIDHRVPPDVSMENYLYYLEKKQTIL